VKQRPCSTQVAAGKGPGGCRQGHGQGLVKGSGRVGGADIVSAQGHAPHRLCLALCSPAPLLQLRHLCALRACVGGV